MKEKRKGNKVVHLFPQNLVLRLDKKEKIKRHNKSKHRRRFPSFSSTLLYSHSLRSESEGEDQETKKFCTVSNED